MCTSYTSAFSVHIQITFTIERLSFASVLLDQVESTRVPGENRRPAASHIKCKNVLKTIRHKQEWNSHNLVVIVTDRIYKYKIVSSYVQW
jgi:hypothetical protein